MGAAFTSGVLAVGAALAFAAALAVPSAVVRATQPSTPVAATPVATTDAPPPSECTTEPIELPIALPPAAATPTASLPDPAALPAGEAANDATIASVTATVRESIACRNAGDLRRAYALMTPGLLAGLLGGPESAPPEIVRLLLEPPARVPRNERVALVAVSDVALLPDGRVRARVETEAAGFHFADLLLFAHEAQGDRWLIDDAMPLGRQPLP